MLPRPGTNRPDTERKRTVADVMTTDVVTAQLRTPPKEIAAAMARNQISAVPVVVETGEVVGVVTASDLLAHFIRRHRWSGKRQRFALGRKTRADTAVATAQSLMSWPPVAVRPDTPIKAAARLAASRRLHFMPVVERGVLVGCVTGSDLNKVYLRSDDSIADEIENHVIREHELLERGCVGVHVDEGIVALTGTLETRDQAVQLVEAVEDVPGVVDVRTNFSFREDQP